VWRSEQLSAKEIGGTIIVQAHQWGGELGRLDLLFGKGDNGAWRIVRHRARLIPIMQDIAEDPSIAEVVARYWAPIQKRYGELIGQAEGDFVARGDDLAHYNLAADAIRETFKTDIEFENMGGIRTELSEGKITYANVIDMDPFDNTVVTFSLSGRQLKEVLKKVQPAVSGVRYKIEKGKLVHAAVHGQPISNDRIYSGSANSFFANTYMKGISFKDTGKKRVNAIIEYIRKKKIVKPAFDGRRVIFP
jgi:5'-nucleotidase